MTRCKNCGARLDSRMGQSVCPACMVDLARNAGASNSVRPSPALTVAELRGRIPGIEFHEIIGTGGMGAVYRATQVDLDREVAVKVLPETLTNDPVFVERFRREARALARLDHANIVRVFGSGVSDGLCYIVMEFVDGVTLREAIMNRAVDPAAALRIVPQICEALEFAHDSGVVHRDIKPENILIGRGGKVKVADFGLAKLTDSDARDTMLTATGAAMGTLRYMAPEQFDGEETDHRTDIYALGVVLYEMLTGHVPMGHFPPASETPGVDPRIDTVVRRTLQREPEKRYQHASQVQTDLFRISKGDALLDDDRFAAMRDREVHAARRRAREPWRGVDWKSDTTLFGYPIMHVASGYDQVTGRKRVAKGWIAIGDVAVGGIAIGGAATGVVALGGVAVGLTALGGVAVGLQLAMGGAAIGGLALAGAAVGIVGIGGLGVGVIALGGGALGYVAIGGGAWGRYVWKSGWNDPAFESTMLGDALGDYFTPYVLTGYVLLSILGPVMLILSLTGLRRLFDSTSRAHQNPMPREVKRFLGRQCIGLIGILPALFILLYIPIQLRQVQERIAVERAMQRAEQLQAELNRSLKNEAEQEAGAYDGGSMEYGEGDPNEAEAVEGSNQGESSYEGSSSYD